MAQVATVTQVQSPAWEYPHTRAQPKEIFFVVVVLFLPFLGPLPRHMEVPRLGVESELLPPAYTRATATWDPSHVFAYTTAHGDARSLTH